MWSLLKIAVMRRIDLRLSMRDSISVSSFERVVGVVALVVLLGGCRGTTSPKPPIHINPNMDWQERFDPQAANAMFSDGRAMRPLVAGTVPRGFLREDSRFYFGRDDAGNFIASLPVPATGELLTRGQERYEIFCAPCHGASGDGQGVITTGNYGYIPAPTYHSDDLRSRPDGYLYAVVANGVRSMPGYGRQVPVADRWAIVAYIRALQRSQHAEASDVPAGVLSSQGQ